MQHGAQDGQSYAEVFVEQGFPIERGVGFDLPNLCPTDMWDQNLTCIGFILWISIYIWFGSLNCVVIFLSGRLGHL